MVAWKVEGIDEFASWFLDLHDDEQVDVGRVVELRRTRLGTTVSLLVGDRWISSPADAGTTNSTSRKIVPRALRIRSHRAAILLLGGDKTGNSRWYDENVPLADDRYDYYLREIAKEGQQ